MNLPATAAFQQRVTLLLDLERVHQIQPSLAWGDEPMYFLCAYPVDGICTMSVTVRARDLAPWVFP